MVHDVDAGTGIADRSGRNVEQRMPMVLSAATLGVDPDARGIADAAKAADTVSDASTNNAPLRP